LFVRHLLQQIASLEVHGEIGEHSVKPAYSLLKVRQRFGPVSAARKKVRAYPGTLVMWRTSSIGVRILFPALNSAKSSGAARSAFCVRYASAARKCRSIRSLSGEFIIRFQNASYLPSGER
jgi:hypothetical protein